MMPPKTTTLTAFLGLISLAQTPEVTPASLPPPSFVDDIVTTHNQYRAEIDLPPLTWSETLAEQAQEWADHLATNGGHTLQHSQVADQGENLWMGTSGHFSYSDMVNRWGAEQQYFTAGAFPEVSSTGSWFDVGHYTQIVWRDTTQVGCGFASAGGNDILVCRYNPPGNYMGRSVY
jgi:hypothetical protein